LHHVRSRLEAGDADDEGDVADRSRSITAPPGVSALKVGADGTLADGMSVIDSGGKPVTLSFEGATADGSTISGELTQPH
jgi:hypothetical protein